MTTDGRETSRRPSSLSNDARILDAAVAQLIAHGVDGFTLRDVAAGVGLSHTAVYSRYDDHDELLADVWQRRSAADLARLIATVGDADTRPGCLGGPGHVVGEPAVRAALELCVAARRCPALSDIVPDDVAAMCADAGLVRDGVVDVMGMGHLLLQVGTAMVGPLRPAAYGEAVRVAALVATNQKEWHGPPPSPVTMPPTVAGPDADLRTRLIAAAAAVISRSGVARATVKRIARVADCSPSALYTIYESREALLVDLISLHALDGDAPARAVAARGRSEAPSAVIAGWLHPWSEGRRRTYIEVYMAAPHAPVLCSAMVAGIEVITDAQLATLPVAASAAPRVREMMQCGETLTLGAAVMAETLAPAGIDLSACDWRPFVSTATHSFMRSLG
jgi:AcrR family transcriptional regulator